MQIAETNITEIWFKINVEYDKNNHSIKLTSN